MIKINLATRKGAVTGAAKGGGLSLGTIDLKLDSLKELPVRRLGTFVALGVVLTLILGSLKDSKISDLEQQIALGNTEQGKLKAELGKMKGYEESKKALDQDEVTLRTKIEVIRKLIADRQVPPLVLSSFANAIPENVWLTEFMVGDERITIKGAASELNQVADFIKSLNESAYMRDVALVSSNQGKDDTGAAASLFELAAKRR